MNAAYMTSLKRLHYNEVPQAVWHTVTGQLPPRESDDEVEEDEDEEDDDSNDGGNRDISQVVDRGGSANRPRMTTLEGEVICTCL